MDDGRRGLPYAPYLMFMIERVIGRQFPKDEIHIIYKIEKTQPTTASQLARSSYTHEDIPESSGSGSRKGKKMKKIGTWLKAIFTAFTYAARTAYED
jgi:hypothetical protein